MLLSRSSATESGSENNMGSFSRPLASSSISPNGSSVPQTTMVRCRTRRCANSLATGWFPLLGRGSAEAKQSGRRSSVPFEEFHRLASSMTTTSPICGVTIVISIDSYPLLLTHIARVSHSSLLLLLFFFAESALWAVEALFESSILDFASAVKLLLGLGQAGLTMKKGCELACS
jgi:hypothetical protein